MKTKTKNNIKLKKGYIELLYQQNPELFEVTNQVTRMDLKCIYSKMTQKPIEVLKMIHKRIGVNYYGYLMYLVNYMQPDNSVSVMALLDYDIGASMINQRVKPMLTKNGLLKKHLGVFYINPIIATKGKAVNPNLVSIFKEENEKFYGVKF